MKVIVVTSPGGPDVLKEIEVPEPELQDDGVLIKVAATALNEPDLTARTRSLPPMQREYLGLECAGTIVKVGKDVQRWQVGQEVCAVLSGGGYAEMVAVQEGLVFPIPKSISVEEAASFPQVACSVWAALFMENKLCFEYWLPAGRNSRLIAGETILVHGGSGGIGSFAVQLAKARGVKVIVTAGSDKLEFCKTLGADACISFNYKDKEDDFIERVNRETDANKGVDVVLSSLPIEYMPWNHACVKQGGTVIKINGCWMLPKDTRARTPQPKKVNSELQANFNIGVAGFRFRKLEERAKVVEEVQKHVWPLIEVGKVKPVVHHRFPFAKAAEAHRLMESGKHFGKILLIPNDRFENSRIEQS
ncbi:putative NADPH:quinone reductase [Rosa chinensis]|uniref:Putative NADPH:quinone reductase n=1 Tax=Rosa chinensis TaxID=74649 RepID=A0A2P6Q9X6_ROSCH|nr:quinone oxidoreductase PIG3-like isoform X1 [Rosa chinensis]PRQ30980.1 putative NADPH:quinone reductase [Rosa chinensis]